MQDEVGILRKLKMQNKNDTSQRILQFHQSSVWLCKLQNIELSKAYEMEQGNR